MLPAVSVSHTTSLSSFTRPPMAAGASGATSPSSQCTVSKRAKRKALPGKALPVTGIANQASVPINRALLKQRMKSMNMTLLQLSAFTGVSRCSMQRWVSGRNDVPWKALDKIAAAVKLAPELLGTKPKAFDRDKLRHYLRKRGVTLEQLVNAGRLKPYSFSAAYKWLSGAVAPPLKAVRVLERGLQLKDGALTDGPLEEVTTFTSAQIVQWGALDASGPQGASHAQGTIKDVLRSWRESNGISWRRFSKMIPGYRSEAVLSWLRGHSEPSADAIAVLQKVMELSPGTLVKLNRARMSRHQASQPVNLPRADVEPGEGGARGLLPMKYGAPELDVGLARAADHVAGSPAPPGELGQLIPFVFEALAQDIGTPQQWSDLFDDLIPRLIVRLPCWPQGRDLCIDRADGPGLVCSGGGSDPAPVRLYRQQNSYYGVEYGQPLTVTPDGDRFFRAMLISMGNAETDFVERLSLGWDRSEEAVIAAVRGQLAEYVMMHHAEAAPLLYACSLRAPSSL